MAKRIVEHQLSWCEARITELLVQNGYTVIATNGQERKLEGRYTRADKQKMVLRPRVEVTLSPLSNQETRLYIGFQLRGLVGLAVLFSWFVIGMMPHLVMISIAKRTGSLTFGLHSLLAALAWLPSCAWAAYCFVYRLALSLYFMERHQDKMEESLWEHLDPEGTCSHQIESPSKAWCTVFSFMKWAGLLLMAIGGFDLILDLLFSTTVGLTAKNINNFWLRVLLRTFEDSEPYYAMPLCLLTAGTLFLLLGGWFSTSWTLPHRYHWKVRFANFYFGWWVVISVPCILLGLYAIRPSSDSTLDVSVFREHWVRTGQFGLTITVLFIQGVLVTALLHMWPDQREEKNAKFFFASPSTRYEWLSNRRVRKNTLSLVKKHRLWTWSTFLIFNSVCYVAGFYLLVCFIESVAGIVRVEWVSARVWHWPLLVHLEGRLAAIEALLLTCVIAAPMLFSIMQVVRMHRKSQTRITFARQFGVSFTEAHLPVQPLKCMTMQLGTDEIAVIEMPDPSVNVNLEKKGFLRKRYLLWISVGARKRLSDSEMEALLWHECGHTELLRRTFLRDIAAILAPWGPRFLDLTRDLYEEERAADQFALESMNNTMPLKSALEKARYFQERLPQQAKQRECGIHSLRDGFAFLKSVWNLDWVGYLHPNINQRLHWLEELEAHGASVRAKGDP